MPRWTVDDIPSQSGRRVIVTGATNGLGYETARRLAEHGATVVAAGRDPARGADAVTRLRGQTGSDAILFGRLDLADLASVREFAAEHAERPLDLLVNNAGVMMIPSRQLTADGFERHLGTNHLGHFALTLLLLPALLRVPGSRVVTVASDQHETKAAAELDLADLRIDHGYKPMGAYGRSKLANVLFTLELDRRLRARDAGTIAVAANPGFTKTNLSYAGPRSEGVRLFDRAFGLVTQLVAQPVGRGVLPQLYAATAPEVTGGQYFALSGLGQQRGWPAVREVAPKARDEALAAGLWTASERLTGVSMPIQAP